MLSLNDADILLREDPLKKIYVEITSGCNLSCRMCYRNFWKDPVGSMDRIIFNKVLRDADEFEDLEDIHFGGIGEPLVHEKFIEFLKLIPPRYGVEISTNGTLLNEKISRLIVERGVKRIIFSLDSPQEQGFLEIRGISSNIIYRNIDILNKIKKDLRSDLPELEIEFVAMRSNIATLPDIVDVADSLGVSKILVSQLLPLDESQKDEILYNSSDFKDYFDEFLRRAMSRRIMTRIAEYSLKTERVCDFMERRSTVIAWDGEVIPCYRFLHEYPEYIFGRKKIVKRYSFGNIMKRDLRDIWYSNEYRRFRWIVKSSLYPSCVDCVFADKKCHFVQDTTIDCEGNSPSCGDCLWSRRLILCP
ncbi:MAG: tungsten cofactor oxidoreductase radical SAM maturase [Thermoplasmatales archaeon]|jgi:tungsten cofactor oxidoreducase radical SAM maturase|nr:tungsten cofactor oxidoreductase radical SAM maturase [Thermoplasmatales archaeon]